MKQFVLASWIVWSTPAAFAQPSEQLSSEQQVVLVTELGSIVLELFPDKAPTHVAKFLERIESDFYTGTTFHRAIPHGIIQGGDPISKDPDRFEQYGTGGLNELELEPNDVSHLAGTLSAVQIPGQSDSAGSQFFICVTDQTQLDGQYTAYGRVIEGLEVVERISLLPTDDRQKLTRRVRILKTYQQELPAPEKIPFAQASANELSTHRVIIHTDLGEIEIRFHARDAIEHVRQFLTFAQLGLYNGTPIHRIVPSFVIQGGSLSLRQEPVPQQFHQVLKTLFLEPNLHKHIRGALSMARGEALNSAMDSFFIVLEDQRELDGDYTVFGEVVRGMDVVDLISLQPIAGETPVKPMLVTMTVVKKE